MKLYLSGPMAGLPDNNRPAFHEAAAQLRAAGYEVLNPATVFPYGGWTAEEFSDLLSWEGCIEGHPEQRLRFRLTAEVAL